MTHFCTKGNAFLKVNVSHNFTKYFCGARVNEIVNNCPAFAICYLWVIKKTFALKKNRWSWNLSIRIMKIKSWHCQIIWYLFAGFKTIIFCSVQSLWFVKYMFSAKIWLVKTRIVKYESRVVKSNPAQEWCVANKRTLKHSNTCSNLNFPLKATYLCYKRITSHIAPPFHSKSWKGLQPVSSL